VQTSAAVDILADQYAAFGGQAQRTSVKEPVMQHAEADPVRDAVRFTHLMLFDVRRFEGQVTISETNVEPANGALALIGAEDSFAEIGTARLWTVTWCLDWEADSRQILLSAH